MNKLNHFFRLSDFIIYFKEFIKNLFFKYITNLYSAIFFIKYKLDFIHIGGFGSLDDQNVDHPVNQIRPYNL
jgi:hypothetical protein